ncbi:hypothetical protein LINPERHAP2_LOCUS28659 [Linum perenne]
MRNIHTLMCSPFFLILIISSCMLSAQVYGEDCNGDADCVKIRPCSPGTISVCMANHRCTCIHSTTEASHPNCNQHGNCTKS